MVTRGGMGHGLRGHVQRESGISGRRKVGAGFTSRSLLKPSQIPNFELRRGVPRRRGHPRPAGHVPYLPRPHNARQLACAVPEQHALCADEGQAAFDDGDKLGMLSSFTLIHWFADINCFVGRLWWHWWDQRCVWGRAMGNRLRSAAGAFQLLRWHVPHWRTACVLQRSFTISYPHCGILNHLDSLSSVRTLIAPEV